MSTSYATLAATQQALITLGFKALDAMCFDSPESDWAGPVVQASIYKCSADYYCVTLSGDDSWGAPVVWSGPKAAWDTSDTTDEFFDYLDYHYTGWTKRSSKREIALCRMED
jgi:hypothetical protein